MATRVVIIGVGERGYVLTWNPVMHPAVDEIVIGDWDLERAEETKTAWARQDDGRVRGRS
jgi:hypothetical protein